MHNLQSSENVNCTQICKEHVSKDLHNSLKKEGKMNNAHLKDDTGNDT